MAGKSTLLKSLGLATYLAHLGYEGSFQVHASQQTSLPLAWLLDNYSRAKRTSTRWNNHPFSLYSPFKVHTVYGGLEKITSMDISSDYQTKLFPYAYNILGSIDDANDVIQDVIANYIESNCDNIKNESAYLIKSVINKSINLKISRKKMVGQTTWLPEPIATENADKKINSQEITSYSMLVLLEYLDPKERAVFILKQAFGYSHQEIAEIFSISIENSRQLLSRAKNTLKEQESDFKLNAASSNDFLSEYVDIIRNGEVKKLEEMLSEHITAQADGGGKGKGVIEFTSGIKAVAQLIVKGYDLYLKKCRIEFKEFNHAPAMLFYKGHKLLACQMLDIDTDAGKINNIYTIVDPQKLRKL